MQNKLFSKEMIPNFQFANLKCFSLIDQKYVHGTHIIFNSQCFNKSREFGVFRNTFFYLSINFIFLKDGGQMSLENKRVLVAGAGKSGMSVADTLLKIGAKISIYDKKEAIGEEISDLIRKNSIPLYLGKDLLKLDQFDLIVLSPGISLDEPFILKSESLGIEIIGELELAYRLSKGKYIAITGTNGKTTTTTLVGEIFKNAGKDTKVVGNIGVAATSKVFETVNSSYLITETSSFQLETIKQFKPIISALLNITEDHLDRHKTMEKYGDIKAKIYQNQNKDDYFVVNYDCVESYKRSMYCKANVVPFSRKKELDFGCFVKDEWIAIRNKNNKMIFICKIKDLKIPGLHNVENVLAATAIAFFGGISSEHITKTLMGFEGVEHRIEFFEEVEGVRFVNDSKGTNPDASIKAVEAIEGSIILIAGGYDKGTDFSNFIKAFNGKVKHMVLLGKTAENIKNTAEGLNYFNVTIKENMEKCVEEAYKIANNGDTVLLSPACASWDMYPNFEVRGRHFKECIKNLRRNISY